MVDRHAALQLSVHRSAFLPDQGWRAGRAGAGRRLPGDNNGLLGCDGCPRRAADLCAWRRAELRQGPARAGRVGVTRVSGGQIPRHLDPEHRCGRCLMTEVEGVGLLSPQQIIDSALASSASDGCLVVVESSTEANVRWANNTVTTNGVARSFSWYVVAIKEGAAGTVTASAASADSSESVSQVVRAADEAALTAARSGR